MALDIENRNPAYLLGRMLAVLERVQQDALGSVNATLVDRYYGSASSTPAAVLPTLLRRTQHHFAKLRRDKPGLAVVRDRVLQEIASGINAFPKTMGLEAQGFFALGFLHQSQDFFRKQPDTTAEAV